MSDYGKLAVHPAADAIPLDSAEHRAELTASIKQKGLKHAIMLTADGKKIIDGRNRYLASVDAGVKPKFKHFRKDASEIEIIDYVQVENLDRRDLTLGQRVVAFRDLERLRGEPIKAEAEERKKRAQSADLIVNQRRHGRGQPQIRPVAVQAGVVGKALGVAAKV